MRKLFFTLTALFISVSSFAQFGIVGGFTASSTKLKEAFEIAKDNKLNNFHAGIAYKIPLGAGFALQPELIYNVKGTIKNIKDIADIDYKTGFIELPLQIQWGIDLKVIRPYVFAEPFIGYALTVNGTVQQTTASAGKIEINDNKFEYGFGLGAGIELFKHLQVSARYYWNLGKLYEFSNIGAEAKRIQIANCNGIQVSAAILF